MEPKRNAVLRVARTACFVVLALAVLAGRSAADDSDPPSFLIETITVEAPRLSAEIVVSESLLREGVEYTEGQLRQAVHRINRLPFVLLAEFALRKGSERGRYELVITVFETRRWFFQVGGDWEQNDPLGVDRLDPRVEGLLNSRIGDTTDDKYSLVGRRFAVAKRGLLFASFGTEDGAFAVGYQHYNLWNRNVLLSLSLAGDEFNSGLDRRTVRAQLGIPIRGNHALRILGEWTREDRDFFFDSNVEEEDYEAEIAWIFNSLDDPVLPRKGALYEAGLNWSDREGTSFRFNGDRFEPVEYFEQRTGVIASAGRYWPFGDRQSVSVNSRAFVWEQEGEGPVFEAEVGLGHQIFLMRRLEIDTWRELRLETQISGLRQDFSQVISDLPLARSLDGDVNLWQARVGLTYRNGWGLFRFSVSYLDRDREIFLTTGEL